MGKLRAFFLMLCSLAVSLFSTSSATTYQQVETIEDVALIVLSNSIPFAAGYRKCNELSKEERSLLSLSSWVADLEWVQAHETISNAACFSFAKNDVEGQSLISATKCHCNSIKEYMNTVFCKAAVATEVPSNFKNQTLQQSFTDIVAEVNSKEDTERILKFADMGSIEFQAAAGWLYEVGTNSFTGQDLEKAQYWYEKAADQGHLESSTRYVVTGMIIDSRKIILDRKPLEGLLQRILSERKGLMLRNAALRGHAEAQYYHALLSLPPSDDVHNTFEYVQEAAERGFAPAQVLLAVLYDDGARYMTLLSSPTVGALLAERAHIGDQDRNSSITWLLRAYRESRDPFAALLLADKLSSDSKKKTTTIVDEVLKTTSGAWSKERKHTSKGRNLVQTLLQKASNNCSPLKYFSIFLKELEGMTMQDDSSIFRLIEALPFTTNSLGFVHVIADRGFDGLKHVTQATIDIVEPFEAESMQRAFEVNTRCIFPHVPSFVLFVLRRAEAIALRHFGLGWDLVLSLASQGVLRSPFATDKAVISKLLLHYSAQGSTVADLALFLLCKQSMLRGELDDGLRSFALKGLQRAADKGICVGGLCAYSELAEALEDGVLLPQDVDKANKLYLKGKEENDPFALFRLGEIATSVGRAQLSLRYYGNAAVFGSFDGIVQVAKGFILGNVVAADLRTARKLMETVERPSTVKKEDFDMLSLLKKIHKATETFEEEIPFTYPSQVLILSHRRSSRTSRDETFVRGVVFRDEDQLLKATRLGSVEAQRWAVEKGMLLYHLPSEVKFSSEIWSWIMAEAADGDATMACIEFQFWESKGNLKKIPDRERAFSLNRIKRLANENCADAQYSLFVKYKGGIGVTKNEALSKRYALGVERSFHPNRRFARQFIAEMKQRDAFRNGGQLRHPSFAIFWSSLFLSSTVVWFDLISILFTAHLPRGNV